MDHPAPLFAPGVIKGGWGSMVLMAADALGIELDEIRERSERAPAPETLDTAMGRIEAGRCAGVRFAVEGVVDGRAVIVAAHANRLRADVGEGWERLSGDKPSGYRIEIEGSPCFTCEIEPMGEDGDHNTAGITATAMRVVNAIPAVCSAPPGVLSSLDLPFFTARMGTRQRVTL